MGSRAGSDDVVDDELPPPKVDGTVEAANTGTAEVEGVWMKGAF
jgi:hypothetical protein